MTRIVLASNNQKKLQELAAILSPLGFDLIPQGVLGVEEAEEPHGTFLENALAKARHAAACTGLPALADDSGLCVDALGGRPGVLSARYGGEPRSDARNNARLLEELAALPTGSSRRAHFVSLIVLLRSAEDPQPLVAEGEWQGEILEAPRGAAGFGYDPLFFVPEQGQTAAEMDSAAKNQVSHRARALAILVQRLEARG